MNISFSKKWVTYFFTIAKTIAQQSKDPSTKVGCVVVDKDKHILATGYNGFPVGMRDTEDRYNNRSYKLKHVCHAEANAICQSAYTGSCFKNAFIFVTLQPCIECSKLIIQSGIKEVHFLVDEKENKKREEMLRLSGDQCVDDWRKSKDEALKMLIECRVAVYAHILNYTGDQQNIDLADMKRYDFSANGEIIEIV